MSTWISKCLSLALMGSLSACQIAPGGFSPTSQGKSMAVLGGAIQVAAPPGYCIDQQSLRQQADGAVVLIGRCSGASNVSPAVITVTIGAAGSAGAIADGGDALAAFFQTSQGLAALSRTGMAGSVQILNMAKADSGLYVNIAEADMADYWRAVFGLSGRLVTLSAQGPEGAGLDLAVGRQLLGATIAALHRSNTEV